MPRAAKLSTALLTRAAEIRAGGGTWEQVAKTLGRSVDTVRKWPGQLPTEWARLLSAAKAQLIADATAESVHTLRNQLRNEDDKVQRGAADSLLKLHIATRPKKTARKIKSKPATDASRVTTYLEGLTDAEIDALLQELAAGPAPSADDPPRPD